MKTTRNKKGFSLIEMMVVLSIVAIIYSFATPTLSRYNARKKLYHESQKLARIVEMTKSYATTQRESFKLVIDADAKEYYYLRTSDTGKEYHQDKVYRCDSGIQISSGTTTIVFATNGSIQSPAGDQTITLTGVGNKQKNIIINGRTGKVTVSE